MKKTMTFFLSGMACMIAAAGTYTLDVSKLQMGSTPPVVGADAFGSTLTFTAKDDIASAAKIPETFDFSKGGKIEFQFRIGDKQSNPFARLLEGGAISIHMQGNAVAKILLTGSGSNNLNQIAIPLKSGAEWHSLSAVIDPVGKAFSLQVDDKSEVIPITGNFDFSRIGFLLGSTSLQKSARGLNGAIRNVKITTPHSLEGNVPKTAKVTPGVRHVTIANIKNRHFAFPGAAVLPGGDLAVVFREGEGHVDPYGRICLTRSKDGGKNWSAPVSVADTETDERDPSIQALPDGRVLVTHGGWNSWMHYDNEREKYKSETAYIEQAGESKFGGSHYLFSTDGGKTFSAPVKVPAFAPHGPAVTADGRFIQPALGSDNGKRQVYIYTGSPDAKNWERTALVGESANGDPNAVEVFEEPHTAILRNGVYVTAIRVPSTGIMQISFSHDQGKSWTEPVKTPVKGYPQHLLELKDGRLLAVYGYRYFPMGVRGCISKDGGKTWDIENEIIIQNNGIHGDLGYPVAVELENGEVLCVYYHNDADHNGCFIEGAFFRP